MQQVIFIGGGNSYPTREDFINELKKWDYNPFQVKKKWRDSVGEKLGNGYKVAILNMPNKDIALYTEWKVQFEKIFQYLEGPSIIIAHSLGTIFILKYLTENGFPNKINQLHLVSALIDNEGLPPEESYIGDFEFDIQKIPEIEKMCEKIFLYHSQDDTCVPISQGKKLYSFLPKADFEIFDNRGHMNMEEFPELIEKIKS